MTDGNYDYVFTPQLIQDSSVNCASALRMALLCIMERLMALGALTAYSQHLFCLESEPHTDGPDYLRLQALCRYHSKALESTINSELDVYDKKIVSTAGSSKIVNRDVKNPSTGNRFGYGFFPTDQKSYWYIHPPSIYARQGEFCSLSTGYDDGPFNRPKDYTVQSLNGK
ncbi:hypothetical protein PRK78_000635 [Emydomyces testavorans]|uniref:Uncharacterized protein n=1 Tax=Emydomyces testavorans TaxID=2070801 RepID=A0AAF0DCA8_9EURO|nr:hypothetical protein PRK78_000635 [Emydomyces testavorans]